MPGGLATSASGQRQKELFHLLDIKAVGVALFEEALLESSSHDGESSTIESAADRGELGDDVLAFASLIELRSTPPSRP